MLVATFALVPAVLTYLSAGHESATNQLALTAGTMAFSLMTANMLLATRPVLIEQWVGGLDRVYELHKWTGAAILALVLVHSQVGFQQIEGVAPPGSIGATAVEAAKLALWPLVAILALSLVKRFPRLPFEIPYQIWRWGHRLVGVTFVMLAFHQLFVRAPFRPTDLISQWLIAMALLGVFAFLWTQLGAPLRRRRFRVIDVQEKQGTTRVKASPVRGRLSLRPGQFAFLSALRGGLREPHPFTVSGIGGDGTVEFSIRASGDFTRRLAERLQEGDTLRLEGGYGTFEPQKGARCQLWVAGGIGVTPFLAAAEALPDNQDRQIFLVHTVRSAQEAVGADRLRAVADRVPGFSYYLHSSAEAGRLTGERVLSLLPFRLSAAEMWFCGPVALRRALTRQFKAAGQRPRRLHYERFEFR